MAVQDLEDGVDLWFLAQVLRTVKMRKRNRQVVYLRNILQSFRYSLCSDWVGERMRYLYLVIRWNYEWRLHAQLDIG